MRNETRCCHIGYSYRLTARVLLYAPSHRQDNTYHGLSYTSRGALAGTRNSSMGTTIKCHFYHVNSTLYTHLQIANNEMPFLPCQLYFIYTSTNNNNEMPFLPCQLYFIYKSTNSNNEMSFLPGFISTCGPVVVVGNSQEENVADVKCVDSAGVQRGDRLPWWWN